METESAMDLSLRSCSPSVNGRKERNETVTILRPIPRPAWSIIWYQNLWPITRATATPPTPQSQPDLSDTANRRERNKSCTIRKSFELSEDDQFLISQYENRFKSKHTENALDRNFFTTEQQIFQPTWQNDGMNNCDLEGNNNQKSTTRNPGAAIVDVACCDGPVKFERVSNPNFAVTVEHNSGPGPMSTCSSIQAESRSLATKTYLCIYCNQSFKSLFCYQKHKKRHLNPVSVDITATHISTPSISTVQSRAKTKDLNVQFFPCKKCGCKFPSYYFVHKHKKLCH